MADSSEGHPNWGTEFDWLAIDSAGHVAILSSAGYGEVPLSVMTYSDALDAAYDRLLELEVVSDCVEQPSRQGDYSTWVRFSERGLFGYDWVIWHGPYERLTVPSRPIHIDDLPEEFAHLARLVVFPMEFASARTIDLGDAGVEVTAAADPRA